MFDKTSGQITFSKQNVIQKLFQIPQGHKTGEDVCVCVCVCVSEQIQQNEMAWWSKFQAKEQT